MNLAQPKKDRSPFVVAGALAVGLTAQALGGPLVGLVALALGATVGGVIARVYHSERPA
jgi:hypothetical protein